MGSGSNQKQVQGSNKDHLSDRNSGPDSRSGPAQESEQRSNTNPNSRKGRIRQQLEITDTKFAKKKGSKMKKLSILIVLLLIMSSVTAYAGNGIQKHEQKRENACSTVLSGTFVTIAGTVISIGNQDGLVVDTGTVQVTIYGIGPEWYWEKNEVDRPDVGDSVTVNAYAVSFSDVTRYIASSITIGDDTLNLRDPETGCPLWRGARNR